jgi:hypothetical protein
MAAYTATDWTIALVTGLARNPRIENGVRLVRSTMTLATAGVYPSNGIPVPVSATGAAKFGMVRNVEYITVYDSGSALGRIYKYSATGNSIRAFNHPGTVTTATAVAVDFQELATTVTNGAPTGSTLVLYVEAHGW